MAEQWIYSGGAASLASVNLPAALAQRAEHLGVNLISLASPPGSPADAGETARLACEREAAWLMADGYHFNAAYQRTLKEAGLPLLWVDDFGQAAEYCADFLLNQNLGAAPAWYPRTSAATQLLLGCRYALLRREFLRWQKWERIIPEHANRLLVTLGGSDPDNATLKVAQALKQLGEVAPKATVVLGGSCPHGASLEAALAGTPHRLLCNAANMPELMAEADMVIAAGGTTAWELVCLGLPTLMLTLSDNQAANCQQLDRHGAVINLGWHNQVAVSDIAQAIARLAGDAELRRRMSKNGRALVDGRGSFRVWLHLHENALKLRPVTEADCRMIWEWANAPEVRAVSFSPEFIPWENHVRWFQARLQDPNGRFWVAADSGGRPLGQVRFALQGAQAVISISLAAAARGRNLGSLLIWTACRKLFREQPSVATVLAWIKPDNLASIRAFEKADFEFVRHDAVKSQPALLYILQRDRTF